MSTHYTEDAIFFLKIIVRIFILCFYHHADVSW